MREKRKRGSTLITVLSVSLIFMALSGVILKSISRTMKSNINQKEREDLRYAAESGLEIARSCLKEKSTITQVEIDEINERMNKVLVDNNDDGIPDGNIGSVKLISPIIIDGNITNPPTLEGSLSGAINGFTIKVRAEKTGNSEIYENIGADYTRVNGGNGSIFDYGVVSGSGGIDINAEGSVNLGATTIAGPKDKVNLPNHAIKPETQVEKDFKDFEFTNTEYKENIILGKLDKNGEIDSVRYNDLSDESDKYSIKGFKAYDAITREQLKFSKIVLDLTNEKIYFNGDKITLGELKTKDKETVVEIDILKEILNENNIKELKSMMKLTNINSKIVDMKLEENPLDLSYHSLICKGELNATGNGTMTIKYGTVFANKIYISKDSSLHVTYQAAKIPDLTGHGVLTDSEEKKLNEVMNTLIPNWGIEDGLGGSSLYFSGNFNN